MGEGARRRLDERADRTRSSERAPIAKKRPSMNLSFDEPAAIEPGGRDVCKRAIQRPGMFGDAKNGPARVRCVAFAPPHPTLWNSRCAGAVKRKMAAEARSTASKLWRNDFSLDRSNSAAGAGYRMRRGGAGGRRRGGEGRAPTCSIPTSFHVNAGTLGH